MTEAAWESERLAIVGEECLSSVGKYVCLSLNTSGPRTVFKLLSFDIWQKLRQTQSDWSGETRHIQLGLSFHSNCFSLSLSSTHHVFKSDVSTCATKIIAFSFHCFHSVITDLHEPRNTTHRLPQKTSSASSNLFSLISSPTYFLIPTARRPAMRTLVLPSQHDEGRQHGAVLIWPDAALHAHLTLLNANTTAYEYHYLMHVHQNIEWNGKCC